jgi:hypothetical protein
MDIIRVGTTLLCASALFGGVGCKIADEDRCAPGYAYNPEKLACEKNPSDDNGVETDTETDTVADTADANMPTGMGHECESNDDCSLFEANVCAVNPAISTGYCTIVDCTPKECPKGYQCCTCTAEGKVREICLADQQAGAAVQFGACSTCS